MVHVTRKLSVSLLRFSCATSTSLRYLGECLPKFDIGKVESGDKISNHIAPISIDEIRVVDEDLAHLLGEKNY
jgi:hypothetical protein